ncbi:hypothetical protein [Leucobacter salsicius]|uniref:hypothetical protein n=1 Tax=Leucobacter salsicius TaxID=664638 RepID=UPI000361A3B2|nr:hypothetical protein [Leucobacter salsicius]
MPQQPGPHSPLPRWVIPTAVAGAVLSFVLLLGFAGSLLWLTVQAPLLVAAAAGQSEVRSGTDPGAPDDSESRLLPPDGEFVPDSPASGGPAVELQQLADGYLEAQRDGTIYDLVPGGEQVDPAYIGAFLYALTDLKSASRFGGTPAELEELLAKAQAYEQRFLAGEDLGTSVKITRGDGSIFESDGKYRLIG